MCAAPGEASLPLPVYCGSENVGAVQIENAEWEDTTGDRLQSAIKTLDPRARDILVSRWTGDANATLHDLADKYGVSAERIRQIEANAIKKLRGLMSGL